MAYKESNPAKVHIVLYIILLSFLLLFHVIYALGALNIFISVVTENAEVLFPMVITGYIMMSCMFPYVPIFFIVVYSVSLYRRGIYGDRHAKNSLYGFFFGIFGMIAPFFLAGIAFMFLEQVERIYVIMPIFAHMVPVSMLFGAYLFVKDIGGKSAGTAAMGMIATSSAVLAIIEGVGLYLIEEPGVSETFIAVLSMTAFIIGIILIVGIVMMIIAFNHASKWVKRHRPLIDTQQKQQLEMQQNQIRMQQEQLELQYQQLEMQKRSMEMLTEMRQEAIEGGSGLIPERSGEKERNDTSRWEYD